MTVINVSELKTLFERVIEKLETEYGAYAEMKLETIIYRLISSDKWNKFEKPEDWFSATDIANGDLQDDVMELKKLIKDKERVCTYVDFDRLASVLREISQVQNPIE